MSRFFDTGGIVVRKRKQKRQADGDDGLQGAGGEAVETGEGQGEFALAAVVVPEGYQGAADFWGVTRKTIQRWRAAGKEKADLCPYRTAPEQMPAWYERVFGKSPPEAVTATLERLKPVAAPKPADPEPAAPGDRLPGLDMSQFRPEDSDYNSMLRSMRTLMMAQQQLVNDAMSSGDRSLRNKATAELRDTVESLRKLEKDGGKILEQQGHTLRKTDVRAIITEAHQFIPIRFKNVLKRKARALPGLSLTDREIDEWADRTVDEACAALAEDFTITPAA